MLSLEPDYFKNQPEQFNHLQKLQSSLLAVYCLRNIKKDRSLSLPDTALYFFVFHLFFTTHAQTGQKKTACFLEKLIAGAVISKFVFLFLTNHSIEFNEGSLEKMIDLRAFKHL